VTANIPPWYSSSLDRRAYGGARDGSEVHLVHGARAYGANGEGRRVARGKNEAPRGAASAWERPWASGGVQPRGGALARTPMRPACGVARDVAVRRSALAELFQTR
jgi:hypothetical protein